MSLKTKITTLHGANNVYSIELVKTNEVKRVFFEYKLYGKDAPTGCMLPT